MLSCLLCSENFCYPIHPAFKEFRRKNLKKMWLVYKCFYGIEIVHVLITQVAPSLQKENFTLPLKHGQFKRFTASTTQIKWNKLADNWKLLKFSPNWWAHTTITPHKYSPQNLEDINKIIWIVHCLRNKIK